MDLAGVLGPLPLPPLATRWRATAPLSEPPRCTSRTASASSSSAWESPIYRSASALGAFAASTSLLAVLSASSAARRRRLSGHGRAEVCARMAEVAGVKRAEDQKLNGKTGLPRGHKPGTWYT
ncbi:unnamed protein product, partial [Polarella glacialis]